MAKIENIDAVMASIKAKGNEIVGPGEISVVVGYTANYALQVHEDVEMKLAGLPRHKPRKGRYWDPQGRAQAKFLEAPARELATVLGEIVANAVAKGASLLKGILMAGFRLQRESMQRAPVDIGNLKASAFTRVESAG